MKKNREYEEFDEFMALTYELLYAPEDDVFWDLYRYNYIFICNQDVNEVAIVMKKELFDRAHKRRIDRTIHPDDKDIIK